MLKISGKESVNGKADVYVQKIRCDFEAKCFLF